MSTNLNRFIINSDTNGVTPSGLSNTDASTIFRQSSSLTSRISQGAAKGNIAVSLNPVYALATVTTTNGSETANDTLTVANNVITLKTSGATGNQVNIATGTAGTSVSAASSAITTSGAVVYFYININGDGAQLVGCTGATGAAIASSLQTNIRALTPFNALNAVAYSSATVAYGTKYTITSGVAGSNSTVVCTPSKNGNVVGGGNTTGAALLKLGVAYGGAEVTGTVTTMNGIANLINAAASSWVGIATAFVCGNVLTLTAGLPGTIGNGLALAVSSSGSVMTLTHIWGAATAGTEGTYGYFSVGL